MDNEAAIIQSWKDNAKPWIDAVLEQGIRAEGTASRDALVAAIETSAQSGCRVLDVGCGEGWLADELAERGFSVTGVDASEELIEFARKSRPSEFHVADLADLTGLGLERFNLVVCNFSLFGDSSVNQFIASVPQLLAPGGVLIIQTLHPRMFCGNGQPESRWHEGTWAGLPGDFGAPPPMFIRTPEDWARLFRAAGLSLARTIEPSAGVDAKGSVIFVATLS